MVTRLVWRFGLVVYGGFSWVCCVACLLILFWWSLLGVIVWFRVLVGLCVVSLWCRFGLGVGLRVVFD